MRSRRDYCTSAFPTDIHISLQDCFYVLLNSSGSINPAIDKALIVIKTTKKSKYTCK